MGLSDSPTAGAQLLSSPRSLSPSALSPRPGSPSLPNRTFPARCPLSPRRVPTLLANVSSRRMAGFRFSGRLATLNWCNEADSGSLALRLTGSLHGAPTRRSLPALSASLHAGRSVRMMNTFQFISSFGGAGAPEDTVNRELTNQGATELSSGQRFACTNFNALWRQAETGISL